MIKRKRAERSYKCYIPILIGSCILASACSPKNGKPDELSEEKMEIIGEETEIEQWYTDNEHFRPDESVTAKRPVIIAILDSDISENVFYEKDVRWINEKEIPNDNIDNDKNGYADDVYGWNFCDNDNVLFNKNDYGIHGTYITSILFGRDTDHNYKGIVADYEIYCMNLKVLHGENESGKTQDLVEAITYAKEMGADICCLSLATSRYSKALEQVIQDSEMLFVVAAGNMGMEIGVDYPVYPACYEADNVIVAGDMCPDGKSSRTSNYSPLYVDVYAPGNGVVGMLPDENYTRIGGTSAAAAVVAAESALIYCTSEEELQAWEIRDIVIRTAVQDENYFDKALAQGYISIHWALEYYKTE